MATPSCDALLLVSFGGPEGPDDVLPFLANVAAGRNVPRERLIEVAKQYEAFGGVSPINAQNRAMATAIGDELAACGLKMPVYIGNRNWHPMLADTMRRMADDGVQNALAFVTSAFGSYPTCRQYQEDIQRARQSVGENAPRIDKLRLFYNHPWFIEAAADRVAEALEQLPPERRGRAKLIFTAHSIPVAMSERSPYEHQLLETCRLVAETLDEGSFLDWQLVYQSRSGPPSQPWLGPDILSHIRAYRSAAVPTASGGQDARAPTASGGQDARAPTASGGQDARAPTSIVVVPIGFLTEHKEVIYDLDIEARRLCDELGITMIRAGVVGDHPRFVQMVRELVVERVDPSSPRLALGTDGPWPDECPPNCCRTA